MNAAFDADYFDGATSMRCPVRVAVAAGRIAVFGEGVALDVDAADARVMPRLGRTPVRIALRGGGLLVAGDYDAVDAALGIPPEVSLAHRLESHALVVAVALAAIATALFLAYRDGIPWAASKVAANLPESTEAAMADATLSALDKFVTVRTDLEPGRIAAIEGDFRALRAQSGLAASTRLVFRGGGKVLGANAFALPGGIIVVTEELVRLLDDAQVAAVIAHEMGHHRHRHGLRILIGGSLHALITFAVLGDAGSLSSIAATAPTLMVYASYSRDFEREADAFAVDLLRRAGRSPGDYAAALEAIRRHVESKNAATLKYLSTHPGFDERIERARSAP